MQMPHKQGTHVHTIKPTRNARHHIHKHKHSTHNERKRVVVAGVGRRDDIHSREGERHKSYVHITGIRRLGTHTTPVL